MCVWSPFCAPFATLDYLRAHPILLVPFSKHVRTLSTLTEPLTAEQFTSSAAGQDGSGTGADTRARVADLVVAMITDTLRDDFMREAPCDFAVIGVGDIASPTCATYLHFQVRNRTRFVVVVCFGVGHANVLVRII